jgi:hypothetical protein
MKARILTAILLMFVFTTAYNQTSRRTRQTNDNNNQRTEKKEQTKETPQPERSTENTTQTQSRRTVRTNDGNQNNQNNDRVNNTDNRNQPSAESSRRENSDRAEARDQHKESGNRHDANQDHRGNDNKVIVRDERREPERGVVVHEYNREPRQKVIIRDNRQENRTYVRIDRPERKVVVVNHPNHYRPQPIEYRRTHYPYRVPVNSRVYWSVSLHNDFRIFYPEIRIWRYDIGYQLPVVAAYDAEYYIGDAARVYGKVYDIYYEYTSDEYYLYFGDYYPYHDFSIVVPGREARAFSRRPERFFRGANVAVTGYLTEFDDKPEIVVRRASQMEVY